MAKSSIHIQPVKLGSEQHNNREKDLNYVRKDLSNENSSFNSQSIAEARAFAEKNYQEKVGQKMQEKATPIREGVLLIEKHHTAEDLKKLAEKIENRFGIKTIQGYCHKDEGHQDKITGEWKPNYHAHMIFDWTNHQTGKSVKMNRDDMAELQTMVAEHLGMERGINSSKKHLNAIQFKVQQEVRDLKITHNLKNGLSEAKNIIEQGNGVQNELKGLKIEKNSLESDVSGLKKEKNGLETENLLLRANKIFLGNQVEEQREELKEIKQEISQSKSKGFGMGR
jgi:hypothetical protein